MPLSVTPDEFRAPVEFPFVFGAYAAHVYEREPAAHTVEQEPLDDAHECDGDCFRAAAS